MAMGHSKAAASVHESTPGKENQELTLLHSDQRQCWQRGERKSVEDYLRQVPALQTDTEAVLALIYHEILLREEAGETPRPEEYIDRFPQLAEQVKQQFEVHQALKSNQSQAETVVPGPPAEETTTDRPGTLPASPMSRAAEAETLSRPGEPFRAQDPGESEDLPPATPALQSGRAPKELPAQFGRYRLERVLGTGGMGAVYRAYDAKLHRHVALKVPRFGRDEGDLRERFLREARSAATLRHPNVCPVFDIGEHDDVPYLTMAYIEGESLCDYLRANTPLPMREAARLVQILAMALQEAHDHGIIHRDLKPGNVIISRKNEPIVTDFGLARRSFSQDERLTQTGAMMGTPAYMPPEQVNGDVAAMGPGCDIYSLGVILYELLVNRRPFEGPLGTLIAKVVMDAPPEPRSFRPELDLALQAICLKALAKRPEERYPSMRAFAEALQAWLTGEAAPSATANASRAPAAAEAADVGEPRTLFPSAAQESPHPQAKSRRGLWILLIVGVLFVTCVLPAGWITVMVFHAIDKFSGGFNHFGARFEEQQKEQTRLREERQKAQQQLEEVARTWQPPPASASASRLFPAKVGAFQLTENDEKADVLELNVAAAGCRAVYHGAEDTLELFAYRATKLEKEAILRRALEALARRGGPVGPDWGSPNFWGSAEGIYLSYQLDSTAAAARPHGTFWWQHDWLFLARGGSPQTVNTFLKDYLTEVGRK